MIIIISKKIKCKLLVEYCLNDIKVNRYTYLHAYIYKRNNLVVLLSSVYHHKLLGFLMMIKEILLQMKFEIFKE